MADVYAADVLAQEATTVEDQVAALLALVPEAESLVIDRNGRVWGLEFGYFSSEGEMYRKVPVTSEEEQP